MLSYYAPVIIILLLGMLYSEKAGKLTLPAAVTGAVIGFIVFAGAGYTGLAMMTTFFILGTVATSWKSNYKQQLGLAEENKGRRTAGQVIANAGVAGILALLILFDDKRAGLYILMIAASFASAAADTLSSELGNVYGRRFYNIITLKKDARGLNGVVSLEGTLIGIAGSTVIALIYFVAFGWSKHLLFIVIAGTFGNLLDSVLGATFERQKVLNNNAVNLSNTACAAIVAWLLALLF
jgi:uncharacterized protein (TIGR00297 family)